MGMHLRLLLLQCYFVSSFVCNAAAFVEEPSGGRSDGFCGRILRAQTQGTRREGHHEFRLRVEGDPETYQPGNTYRVVLQAASPSYFRGFTLIALKEGREGTADEDYAGRFQIIDDEDTQFMTNCPPAVTESTPRRRTRIQVLWTAPPSGTGRVILKASIVQKRVIYFQDEGSLTVRLYEKGNEQLPCCACGTAKYRLTFYGNWSEEVHPKDYPRRANHWSALIGASHSRTYVLWEYGGYASEGVRQVAELGSPIKMEEEIRQKGDEVLTVIKTKAQWPAWQPLNLRAAPSAEFSVDRTHHLMSFLTMLGPSPDWNVGLSGEDLCTKDCGWVQRLVTDLIPWDAGTDSGVTYESPNKPTIPQEKIRPLTSLDHPQSPFYDPEGGAILPVARVVVERIARKGEQCNVVPDTIDDIVADIGQEEKEKDDTPETCIYSAWSPWSACSSATCDKGRRMRQRMLKAQLDLSVPCPHTQDFQPCMGPGCSMEEPSTCMMSEWISWSACSVSCGMGMRSRERYVKQYPEDGSLCQLNTEETENRDLLKYTIPCMLSPWSEWSECSVTCGRGVRTRQRMLKSDPAGCTEELEQTEKCMLPECCECLFTRFLKIQPLIFSSVLPSTPAVDCMVSDWSDWSECNKSCGKGHTIRTRMIKLEPQFGGSACPETIQRKKCKIRKCRTKGGGNGATRGTGGAGGPAGCRMQPWTSWTGCTKPCGGGMQERFRTAKKRAKGSCKDRREIRVCNNHSC
uniref:Spondin-1 n=1 Tax=Nothobranchius furzeri TaxID=105023 RepID=A0A8C6PBB6_NOTFU